MHIETNEYIITLKKNMVEKNIRQEFRVKKIEEKKNYFIEEINLNGLMSKKHKKIFVCF